MVLVSVMVKAVVVPMVHRGSVLSVARSSHWVVVEGVGVMVGAPGAVGS